MDKIVKVSYHTVNGQHAEVDYPAKELMENIFPDMSPPIITIGIHTSYNGQNVVISLHSGGVSIHPVE